MEIITDENYWLERLRDADGVTLGQALQHVDQDERAKVKEAVFAHAKELPHLYRIPGERYTLWPDRWHGRFGLIHDAILRAAWLAAPKCRQDECHEARTKSLDYSYRARKETDWRKAKELLSEARFWDHRASRLGAEIYGTEYQSPACLI